MVVRLRLVDDWKRLMRRAWSVRLIGISILLSGVEVGVQAAIALGAKVPIPPGSFAVLAAAVSVAAGVARLVAQPTMRGE